MSQFVPALPHGPIVQVADAVYAVRGAFQMGPGMRIDRTMTILRAPDGLVIMNPIRLSEDGEVELASLGAVAHLVKLSDAHGVDEPYYVHRYRPAFWALPGAKTNGVAPSRVLGPPGPSSGGPIPGGTVIPLEGGGPVEAAYHVPLGGGTLVTCDAVQNCAKTEYASFVGRLMTPLLGFRGGVVVPPMWRKHLKLSGPALRAALAPMTERPFANLITGHGPPVAGGADRLVVAAIDKAAG